MDDLDALYDQLDAYADSIRAKDRLIEQQASRIAELEAARIAYASEFPPDAEGLPDVGNIHANIRLLKSDLAALRSDIEAQIQLTREAMEIAANYRAALEAITCIEKQMWGGDWDEIELAQKFANAALSQKEAK